MAREISGNLITLAYSTNLSDPLNNLKTIVCEDQSEGGLDSNVNTTVTKCGSFSSVEEPTGTITGSGVINADPDSDEGSFQELLGIVKNRTPVYAVYQNAAESPDLTEGQGVFMAGRAIFNSARANATQGTPTSFNWSLTFTGDIDTEYPASA